MPTALTPHEPAEAAAPQAPGLPPFLSLLPKALMVNAVVAVVFLVLRLPWLALGIAVGTLVGVAIFWSLHLISTVLVSEFLEAEAARKEAKQFGPKSQAVTRRAALWRLAGMLALKYVGLAVTLAITYHFVKEHLIPFFLAFTGAFALTQISIVSAAARASRVRK